MYNQSYQKLFLDIYKDQGKLKEVPNLASNRLEETKRFLLGVWAMDPLFNDGFSTLPFLPTACYSRLSVGGVLRCLGRIIVGLSQRCPRGSSHSDFSSSVASSSVARELELQFNVAAGVGGEGGEADQVEFLAGFFFVISFLVWVCTGIGRNHAQA